MRVYGEDETKESPLAEFWLGFLIGSIGFSSQIGWVFVSLGWINGKGLLLISLIIGSAVGCENGLVILQTAPAK
jgi:hypothetical protein